MRYRYFFGGLCSGLFFLFISHAANAETMAGKATPEDLDFFESKVRPVLSQHCYGCHGAEKQKGGLRLDHIQSILKGGDTRPALIPGNVSESLLGIAISYDNVDLQMPPKGRLPEESRAVLAEWITRGAPWPDEALPENKGAVEAFDLEKRREEHWAWQPVSNPTPPSVQAPRFQKSPIDQFLEAARKEKGLITAPETDRRTLIRRAYFAITGLPPTPEAVEEFANDDRPGAYSQLLDELLQDATFGERWARHWFDLVRYSDTHGHEGDYPIRHAWTYRDYVIRAINEDVSYDQFVREHIAGDLLEEPRRHPEAGYNESILATGFWFMHQATHAPVDVKKDQADRVDNQLDVMSKAFLGMTVSCARCHDHKFDAISARDYYAMAGHLYSVRQSVAFLDPGQRIHSSALTHRALLRKQKIDLRAQIEGTPQLTDEPIAPYLEGAAKVLYDAPKPSDGVPLPEKQEGNENAKNPVGRPVEKVAEELGLDTTRLAQWRDALMEPEADRPNHPLYVWKQLNESARAVNTRAFLARAHELAAITNAPAASPEVPDNNTFATFDDGTFENWFVTGDAFGDGPTIDGTWHALRGELAPVKSGLAHSGLTSERLQGTLRSPSFTIDCDFIHFRVAGRNARIRLVIDGYQLTPDNGLLFGDTLKDIGDTRGVFTWVTMGKQVGKYRGSRAYIELIDESDGYIAVDKIVFSNQPDAPQEIAIALEGLINTEITIKSMLLSDLALNYEKAFQQAWSKAHGNAQTLVESPVTALLIRRSLWEPLDAHEHHDQLRDALLTSEAGIGEPLKALVATSGTSENAQYFIRGDHRNPDGEVPKAFLTALAPEQLEGAADRIALANTMVAPTNPLTARVYVNRVWHHLFGKGLVPSVDNFGALGHEPSHPALLDYLASQFMAEGWSTKTLIKEIMLTATYRMSSVPVSPETETKDPANVLLHRMPVQRLEGEVIRDSLLALGGNLDSTMYGPSVPAYIPPFERNRRSPSHSGPMDGDRRRTVYLEVRRNHLLPIATAFDMPIPDTTVGSRTVSNLPAQALIMMNDPFVVDQAFVLGERLLGTDPESLDRVLNQLFEIALAREPRAEERTTLANFVTAQATLYGLPAETAWKDSRVLADLCHTVFMLKEFIYIG